jgi:hypothetical protein
MKRTGDRLERDRVRRAEASISKAIAQRPMAGNMDRQSSADLTSKGSAAYDRERDLGRLIALWPKEIADTSTAGRLRIVARLRQALRAERVRGRAGHWAYDLNRHVALALALKAEMPSLDALAAGSRNRTNAVRRNIFGLTLFRNNRRTAPRRPAHARYGGSHCRPARTASICAPSGGSISPCGADPSPFSWPEQTARRRSWAPPSGNRAANPTFRDTLPESSCSECEDGA